AAYNELALAETDLIADSLPPNPTFSISRIAGNGALEVERRVVGDILALATLPFRSDIARERFRKAQLRAAEETLRARYDWVGVEDADLIVALGGEVAGMGDQLDPTIGMESLADDAAGI
ncbi:hypothetical protein LTR94_035602, partial [Friedmanniomyces endolithicus]